MEKIKAALFCLLSASATLVAQNHEAPPKLIVGLTVEGLRTDYLERFSPAYGDRGFRRLWREARIYETANYGFWMPDIASASATIYTGSMPRIHGIVGATFFDETTLRLRSTAQDADYMGNYTSDSSSPLALQAGTLGDELKDTGADKTFVFSIAPTREAAIMSAGHGANNAIWLDERNGMWCSSTYYGAFPVFIGAFNLQNGIDKRYTDYAALKASPAINTEINRLLPLFFDKTELGKDNACDLLALTYMAGETQEAYVELDQAIAHLLNLLEQRVGKDNLLLFIASTPPAPSSVRRTAFSNGEFHLERCKALLNMYLMAIHGQGQWVEDYNGLQLYLNKRLIEEQKLSLREVQDQAAEFLAQMSGIREVYTSTRLLQAFAPEEAVLRRNAYMRGRGGDIWIDLLPGWTVIDAKRPNTDYISRSDLPPSLLLFWGHHLTAERLPQPITMDRIAPTLSKAIRIRAPNGCTAMPLW